MSQELAPRLNPSAIEPAQYQRWQEGGHFHVPAEYVLKKGLSPYVIVIPPPNVTAALHMGHGLNSTIQDVLIRWRRMQGRASLWVPGTDHAGIATQNVVERRLANAGSTKEDLGREGFVEAIWDFVDKTGNQIITQLKSLGASCDWERTRFTLDENLSRAVREVFVHLYEQDLIYRGEYIINWCPRCHTALSNEEAEGRDSEGKLWHIRYPLDDSAAEAAQASLDAGADAVGRLDDGRWYLTVSTTRPETMLGDTGVAVHPEDDRYVSLVDSNIELPFTDRTIPVVADEHVDPEFGSGLVKVTPAHDPNDFEIASRSGLEILDVMTDDAKMNESVPSEFQDMDRFDARDAVLEGLSELGLLAGEEEYMHAVPHCYRCDTVVEPRLSLQWFVKMKPLAEPALQASREGTVTFTPGHWQGVYEHWMENIRDWCISRQLWWGHRIPVWYCGCGEQIVAREDPTECLACGSTELEQDPDVLDTWFSSQLWPFSVFGWPEKTPDLEAFYPGNTMVTAPEILFFWVARMIMMGYEFFGEPPFTEVYLHGTVRDMQGRKMSKSLGNGIDPLEVVNAYGADAMRFTIISQAAVGTDINLDHEDVEATFSNGRNFSNKIWNAGRFALLSLGDAPVRPLNEVMSDLALEDRWILARLGHASRTATRNLERYRLHEVADGLYHFFWGELCDWYLELVKDRLTLDTDAKSREAARSTLVAVLDEALRLLHPIVPFVTAELWSLLPWPEGSSRPEDLIIAPWPDSESSFEDPMAENQMEALRELITEVRRLRKEYSIPEGKRIGIHIWGGGADLTNTVMSQSSALERLARIDRVVPDPGTGVGANAVLNRGGELFIPLEGIIDLDHERTRLREEIEKLGAQIVITAKKLENQNFVSKAPEEVVSKEKHKLSSFQERAAKLEEKLDALEVGRS